MSMARDQLVDMLEKLLEAGDSQQVTPEMRAEFKRRTDRLLSRLDLLEGDSASLKTALTDKANAESDRRQVQEKHDRLLRDVVALVRDLREHVKPSTRGAIILNTFAKRNAIPGVTTEVEGGQREVDA